MIQPPSPPQKASEYLSELAEYYRELIEYHQQAAIAAAQQLGHVEALLGNDPGLPTHQVDSWLVDESLQHKAITPDSNNDEQSSSVGSFYLEETDSSQELELLEDEEVELVEDEENNQSENLEEFTLPRDEQLQEFFKEERGNMVQIDYILHHFFDISEQTPREELLELLSEQLKKGSDNQLWSQIPDSPDCWTFALSDFAEFAPSNQDNPLFPDLKSEVLPTTEVAELLSIKPEKIYEFRDSYPSEFVKGVDYFQNNRGHYFWSQSAMEKLKNKRKKLPQKPSDIPMLPEYRGLSRVDAIKKLFASQSPKNWTITDVVNGLYGDIEKKQARHLRDPISQTLAAGHYKS